MARKKLFDLIFRTVTKKTGGGTMARPIEPTPVLRGNEARDFEKRLKQNLEVPSYLQPTPKLEDARRLVKEHAVGRSKCIRKSGMDITALKTIPPEYDKARNDAHVEKIGWQKLLLSKFPAFDPSWPDDVISRWFDAFRDLMGEFKNESGD
jgi:hypothetical protein